MEGFIVFHIYKKGDKTDCSNYTWISLLPTALLVWNSIATDLIFCIRQMWERK